MRRKLLFALVAVYAASAPGSALADAGCVRRAVDFTAAVELEVGLEPRAIVAADLNHDGIPDLASADSDDDTLSVLIGLGRGMFQPRGRLAAGGSPYDVHVADFNKDGHTDLVAANRSADYVSILLGGGDGTFASQRRVKTGGLSPRQVIPRDFDGDGNIDLAAADSLGVSLLRGKGDGTFLAPRNYPVTGYLWYMAAADLNGDALPDLALVDDSLDRIPIFLAEAGGSFVAGSIPVGPEPASVVAGDLDGDGDSDLAVSRDRGDIIEVLLGTGDGTFVKASEFSVASDDVYDTGVLRAAADVDTDGDLDLLTVDQNGNGVTIVPGNGDGSFGPHTRWSSGGQTTDVAVADLDGDGRPDLATPSASMNTLWLLFGRGEGRFRAAQRKFCPLDPIDLAAGDFDGDGDEDLATVDLKRNDGQIFLGTGDGTIQSRRGGGFLTGPSQKAIAAGDFDEDGRWEIVTAGGTPEQGNLWVRKLTDQGYSLALELPASSLAADVAAADADGDRHLDLVTANPEIDSLAFYRGRVDEASITADLESLKAQGISGVTVYSLSGPGVTGRGPDDMSPAWRALFRHTLREAERPGNGAAHARPFSASSWPRRISRACSRTRPTRSAPASSMVRNRK